MQKANYQHISSVIVRLQGNSTKQLVIYRLQFSAFFFFH